MVTPLRICLVDDSEDFQRLTQQVFQRYLPASALLVFSSGQALLNSLPLMSELPGLILLDQHMPHMTGLQTLMALKQQPNLSRIPVVMISADASHSEISRGFEIGARSFLAKPSDLASYQRFIDEVVRYVRP